MFIRSPADDSLDREIDALLDERKALVEDLTRMAESIITSAEQASRILQKFLPPSNS